MIRRCDSSGLDGAWGPTLGNSLLGGRAQLFVGDGPRIIPGGAYWEGERKMGAENGGAQPGVSQSRAPALWTVSDLTLRTGIHGFVNSGLPAPPPYFVGTLRMAVISFITTSAASASNFWSRTLRTSTPR